MSWPLVCSSLHRVKAHSWPTTWNASVSEGICRQGTKQQFCFPGSKSFCMYNNNYSNNNEAFVGNFSSVVPNWTARNMKCDKQKSSRFRLEHANVGKKKKKVETQPCSTRRTQSLQQFPSYISLAQKMLLPNKQAHRQNKLRRHVTAIGEAGRGKYKSSSVNKWSGGGAGGKRGRLLTGRFNMVTSVKCDSLALLRVDHGCLENWKMSEWEKMK